MSNQVDSSKIEGIVGVLRHPTKHVARWITAENNIYILHSAECLKTYDDLRVCPYSFAMDDMVEDLWDGLWDEEMDVPVFVSIRHDRIGRRSLVPEDRAGTV